MAKPANTFLFLIAVAMMPPVKLTAQNQSPPTWLNEHMTYMTAGTGVWIADNSRFKSESEPFDAYATEWKWGVGKQTINGRLYAIRDGKEVDTFWEYQVFWHPADKKAMFYQIGSGGAVGIGEMYTIDSDSGAERTTEMTFFAADGTSWRDLHRLVELNGEHRTTSYGYENGSWSRQRNYVWKLAGKDAGPGDQ